MIVQDFFDKAFDMSLRALVIDGLQGEVVEKSRTTVLHPMLLGNLSPEICKGFIAKNPKSPDEILQKALLKEKACRSVNPFYSPHEDVNCL